jgi:hypothetical protein
MLIKLHQPGPAQKEAPDACEVTVSANGHLIGPDGTWTHGGGMYELEMVRLGSSEVGVGQNPWRIRKQVALKIWERKDWIELSGCALDINT